VLSYPLLPITAPAEITSEAGWVSAGRTRNYLLRDPLLDWLDLYGADKGFVRDDYRLDYDARTDFLPFIYRQGNCFEHAVLDCLREKTSSPSDAQLTTRARAPR
jgi:hypothetical protein